MTIQNDLRGAFGNNSGLEQIQKNVFRLYAPFFHEDGDMYSIYLETGEAGVTIRDYGNTLMRVSYTFDVSTPKKQTVLRNIVESNLGELDDGELLIHADPDRDKVMEAIYQYAQLVAKVSNIDILSRETVKSMFYDYLNDFVMSGLQNFRVERGFHPTNDRELEVDYMIQGGSRPIYLFGVNGDTKASRTVISCLTFQKKAIPFRSVIVHEDLNALTGFNRRQITNVSDKQFFTFPDFKEQGADYLARECCA